MYHKKPIISIYNLTLFNSLHKTCILCYLYMKNSPSYEVGEEKKEETKYHGLYRSAQASSVI